MTAGARAGLDADPTRLEHHARRAMAEATTPADAVVAVTSARRAAVLVSATLGPGAAADLLGDALAVLDRLEVAVDRTVTAVEWAEALVAAGRLVESREAAKSAALAAERDSDAVLLGRAALALSGLWANELRAPDVRGHATGLQRRALARLTPEHAALALRLRARLAATRAFYGGETLDELRGVLAEARALGDGRAVAEALSLLNHILLGPDDAEERVALADEMVTVSAEAGEPALAVIGLCWRAVHLYLAGDLRADRALATLRSRDEAMPCLAVTYQRRVLDVMTAVRAGHLAEAEQLAHECLTLGEAVGDADALAYFGAHLLLIRWFQGRDDEMLELFAGLATAPTLDDVDYTFDAAHAALATRCGRFELAASLLERLRRLDLTTLPRRSTWMTALMGVIVAAAAIDDRDLAAVAYDLMAPYGHLPVMPSFAVIDFGAADHFLGLAARCLGRHDDAVAHFERAVTTNARTGNLPLVCIGRVELADTLAGRGAGGDHERALQLLDRAAAEGDALGLTELCRRWRLRRDELARASSATRTLTLRRLTHGWALHGGDAELALPDMVGLHHLADLLAAPGREIPAVVLAGGASAPKELAAGQEVLDESARRAFRQRVHALTARIDDARERDDAPGLGRAQDELDAVVAELRSLTRHGRSRRFADADERARTAVRKAIVRAIEVVTELDAGTGEHLRRCVSTGTRCVYDPASLGPTLN